ncbi:hypothetical protein JKG47_05025 [Acidithiobacillus sp. MC6.1]|nr:hypothetical protein [Acidithiobacillus sp. MC6.1]
MSEAREYLNTGDEYGYDILRIAAKAIAEAYQTTYDAPKNLPDGWIGIRVDINPERLQAVPGTDAKDALQGFLDLLRGADNLKTAEGAWT